MRDPAQVRNRAAGHLEDVVPHPAKTTRHVLAELDLQPERRAPVMCLRHRRERRRQPWRRRRHRIRGRRRRAFARRVHRAHPEGVALAVGEARHLLRGRRPARGVPRLRAFLLVLVGRDRLRRDLRRRNPLQARPAVPRLRLDRPRRPGQLAPGRSLQPHRHHLPVRQAHTVRPRLPPVGVVAHGRRTAVVVHGPERLPRSAAELYRPVAHMQHNAVRQCRPVPRIHPDMEVPAGIGEHPLDRARHPVIGEAAVRELAGVRMEARVVDVPSGPAGLPTRGQRRPPQRPGRSRADLVLTGTPQRRAPTLRGMSGADAG